MPPLRLPADPDARVRGHRALRADVGAGSDVVQKEMYTFEDRSGRSLTLRPEGTAPICRAYVEHGMHREPQPAKLYTIGTMYRYSAPQRGRHREHWQLSVEAIGSDEPSVDAEVIQLYHALLERLGVGDFELALNSIGCRECRPAYLELLRAWLDANLDRLDARRGRRRRRARCGSSTTSRRSRRRPRRPSGKPRRSGTRSAPRAGSTAAVRRDLDACDVPYTLVPTLVRGLDYYTRTAWEFLGPDEGAQSTLSGGGRYDGLVEEIGGPATPGVGFGAGIERLLLALEHAGVEAGASAIDVFFALEDGAPRERVVTWLRDLRALGLAGDTDYAGRSLKGQLTQAARLGAAATVVVRADGATVRRVGSPDEDVALDDVAARLRP